MQQRSAKGGSQPVAMNSQSSLPRSTYPWLLVVLLCCLAVLVVAGQVKCSGKALCGRFVEGWGPCCLEDPNFSCDAARMYFKTCDGRKYDVKPYDRAKQYTGQTVRVSGVAIQDWSINHCDFHGLVNWNAVERISGCDACQQRNGGSCQIRVWMDKRQYRVGESARIHVKFGSGLNYHLIQGGRGERKTIRMGTRERAGTMTISGTTEKPSGKKYIKVNATTRRGRNCSDTFRYRVKQERNRKPTARCDFQPETPQVDQPIAFDGSKSSDPDGNIERYRWHFPTQDSPVKYGAGINNRFSAPGRHQVRLTVADNDGATDTATCTVDVKPACLVKVSVQNRSGEPLESQIYINERHIGETGPDGKNTISDMRPGQYQLKASKHGYQSDQTVTSLQPGERKEIKLTLKRKNQSPEASFEYLPSAPRAGAKVKFDASSSKDPDGTIDEFVWNVTSEQRDAYRSGSSFEHSFSSPGRYQVTLKVKDNEGATDITSKYIKIKPKELKLELLQLKTTEKEYSPGDRVILLTRVKNPSRTPVRKVNCRHVVWTEPKPKSLTTTGGKIPPGTSTTLRSAWKLPPGLDSGVYDGQVVCNGEAEQGKVRPAKDSSLSIKVVGGGLSAPQLRLDAPKYRKQDNGEKLTHYYVITGQPVKLTTEIPKQFQGSAAAYRIYFGDGNHTDWRSRSTVRHSYDTGLFYEPYVQIKDQQGEIKNSKGQRITVSAGREVSFRAQMNQDDNLTPLGSSPEYISFDKSILFTRVKNGDRRSLKEDLSGSKIKVHGVFYEVHGTQVIMLLTLDHYVKKVGQAPADNHPPEARFVVGPDQPQVGETIHFDNKSNDKDGNDDIRSWSWKFGDGSKSQQKSPTHRYQQPGTYSARLTVTDSKGESDTYTKDLTIQAASQTDLVYVNSSAPLKPYSPSRPTRGKWLKVTFAVRNDGKEKAEEVPVKVGLSHKGKQHSQEQVISLGPGEQKELTFESGAKLSSIWTDEIKRDWYQLDESGTYQLSIEIDPNNLIAEPNEDNNGTQFTIQVPTVRLSQSKRELYQQNAFVDALDWRMLWSAFFNYDPEESLQKELDEIVEQAIADARSQLGNLALDAANPLDGILSTVEQTKNLGLPLGDLFGLFGSTSTYQSRVNNIEAKLSSLKQAYSDNRTRTMIKQSSLVMPPSNALLQKLYRSNQDEVEAWRQADYRGVKEEILEQSKISNGIITYLNSASESHYAPTKAWQQVRSAAKSELDENYHLYVEVLNADQNLWNKATDQGAQAGRSLWQRDQDSFKVLW